MKRSDIEIMAPAGSYESLEAAAKAGADSIYFGIGRLNMRSQSAANFGFDDLCEIVLRSHRYGMRAYMTVNTIIYEQELEQMRELIDMAANEGVDAVIVSDQAAMLYARTKGLEVHCSTQLNISNSETLRFYSQWADVAVLARELTLDQIGAIARRIVDEPITGPSGKRVRIEMFAHGALCMAVSGRCYLSAHDNGCSANRGQCRQLCRHSYELHDRDTGNVIDVEGRYLLSPKDLCTIDFLDRFVEAGVGVLKIEGRARSAEYVKHVVECYDQALRAIEHGSYNEQRIERWKERLSTVFNRGFWGGYYAGQPVVELSKNYGSSATKRKVFVGIVTNVFKRSRVAEIEVQASPVESGSDLLVTGQTTGALEFRADSVYVDDRKAQLAPQGIRCSIAIPSLVHRGDRVFKVVDSDKVEKQQ